MAPPLLAGPERKEGVTVATAIEQVIRHHGLTVIDHPSDQEVALARRALRLHLPLRFPDYVLCRSCGWRWPCGVWRLAVHVLKAAGCKPLPTLSRSRGGC